jgi:putative nucleotidyltransferase with HDIG domain
MLATATTPRPRLPRPTRSGFGGTSHATRLRAALDAVDALPVKARVQRLFLEHATADDASPAALASIADSDPALAARLLQLANRAGGSSRRGVVSTTEAIEVLGRRRAHTAISRLPAYSLVDSREDWDDEVDRFRVHAVAVRARAATVARDLGDPNPYRVATIALLHDIGKLVLARVHRGYPDSRIPAGAPDERAAAERRALGYDHALIGGFIARRWELPKVLSAGIENHHAQDAVGDSAIVRLADMLVHRAQGTRVPLAAVVEAARQAGLQDQALGPMLDQPLIATEITEPTERCPLTARQLEVIRGLASGQRYDELAHGLGLSPSTIRSHLHEAYRRLGVLDRAQAVLLAAERGWIGPTSVGAPG